MIVLSPAKVHGYESVAGTQWNGWSSAQLKTRTVPAKACGTGDSRGYGPIVEDLAVTVKCFGWFLWPECPQEGGYNLGMYPGRARWRHVSGFVLLLGWQFAAAAGPDEIPRHILNLAAIQRNVAADLKRLPNYSCVETIDRYTKVPREALKPFDRIRIQVAIVEGRELYSWPGAKVFSDRHLSELVSSGFLSDGDFAAMARNVFVGRTATITFVGEEVVRGRQLLRYDFRIPQMLSGWSVRLGGAAGVVGAVGSFWADAKTLELARLKFDAEDLPAFSTDKALGEDVEYGRVHLGGSDILLPLSTDLTSESFDGSSHWNHATFSGCKQYGAESAISFGDEMTGGAVPDKAVVEPAAFPSGISLRVRLETPIDCLRASVGDVVQASLARDVRVDRKLYRQGSPVSGVVRAMERHEGNRPYYEVGLEFTGLDAVGDPAIFAAGLDQVSSFPGYHKTVVGFGVPARPASVGVGYFYVEASSPEVPAGAIFSLATRTLRMK